MVSLCCLICLLEKVFVCCAEGFLDQNSPHFLEEFPQLAAGGEEKAQTSKKEEENKELQYGPGPSLRPQSKFVKLLQPLLPFSGTFGSHIKDEFIMSIEFSSKAELDLGSLFPDALYQVCVLFLLIIRMFVVGEYQVCSEHMKCFKE